MEKNTLGIVSLVLLSLALLLSLGGDSVKLRGVGVDQQNFVSPTRATTQCAVAGGTLLAASSTGRVSFLAAGVGSSTVYLCRSSTCTSFNGIPLRAVGTTTNTGVGLFEQNDGYAGAYFCASGGSGSSTVYTETK